MDFLAFNMDQLPFVIIVIILAFTLHEFAHAYVADRFGDPTPRAMGRVTLHPLAHIDWLGFALILIAGFGWAKPVLVNRGYFRHPRRMHFLVTLAGPLSNLVQAFVGVILVSIYTKLNLDAQLSVGAGNAIYMFLGYLISINIILFIFNLIPVPPLDGFHMLSELLPRRWSAALWNHQNIGMFIFLAIVFIPPLRAVTIDPLFALSDQIIMGMATVVSLFT